jgi:hypothetical protein
VLHTIQKKMLTTLGATRERDGSNAVTMFKRALENASVGVSRIVMVEWNCPMM